MYAYEEICLLKKIAEYFTDINKLPLAEIIAAEFKKEVQNFPNFRELEYVNENLKSIFNKHIKLKRRLSENRSRKSLMTNNDVQIGKSVSKKTTIVNIIEPERSEVVEDESTQHNVITETNLDSTNISVSTNFVTPVTSTPFSNIAGVSNSFFTKPDQSKVKFESTIMDTNYDDGMQFSADDNIAILDVGVSRPKNVNKSQILNHNQLRNSMDYYEHYFIKPSQSVTSSVNNETSSTIEDEKINNVPKSHLKENILLPRIVNDNIIEQEKNGKVLSKLLDSGNNSDQENNQCVEEEIKIIEEIQAAPITIPSKQGCEIATQCDENDILCMTQAKTVNNRKRPYEGLKTNYVDLDDEVDDVPEDLFPTEDNNILQKDRAISQDSQKNDVEIIPRKRSKNPSLSSLDSLPEEITVKVVKTKKNHQSSNRIIIPFNDNKKLDLERRILLSDGWILWPKSLLSGCLKLYDVKDFKEVLIIYGLDENSLNERIDFLNCCLNRMFEDKLIVHVYHKVKKINFYMKASPSSIDLDIYNIDAKTYEDQLWVKSLGPKYGRRLCAEFCAQNVKSLLGLELSFVESILGQNKEVDDHNSNGSEDMTEEEE